MAEKYTKSIAKNPKVAFIHISQDQQDADAEKWATKEKFPWLTVLPGNFEGSGLLKYYTEPVVPFYTMVDGKGKEVAQGADAIFKKIAELK